MEEQLTLINEHQDSMLSQMETLYISVQQHTELFETLQKSLATQQVVISDMMLKLSKLERGGNPLLLPLPPPTPGANPLNSLMTVTPGTSVTTYSPTTQVGGVVVYR